MKNKIVSLFDEMRWSVDVSAVLIIGLGVMLVSLTQSDYLLWSVWKEDNRTIPNTYIWIAVLTFSVLCFTIAYYKPAIAGGMVLGAHGFVSSLGALAGINFPAIIIISVLVGQVLSLITKKLHYISRPVFDKSGNANLALFLLLGVFCIGIIGELTNNIKLSSLIWMRSDVLGVFNDRTNPVTSFIVLSRWLPYLLIIFLGAFTQGLSNVLKAYSIAVLAQFMFIPTEHYAVYINWIYLNKTLDGFEWVAINRAYLGYEAVVASLGFMIWGLTAKRVLLRYTLFLLLVLSWIVVIISWSKGPILALTFVLILNIFTYFAHLYSTRLNSSWPILIGFMCITFFFVLTIIFVKNKQILSGKIVDSLRIEQSIQIRGELLTKSAFPSELDIAGWLFGRGFGWSRWQESNQVAEFVGSGTHIFWLDLLLDVGLFGLSCFVFALVFLWRSVLGKDCQNDFSARYVNWFFVMFGVVLFVKLAVASDTYSEPLMAMLLALLLSRASLHGERS